MWMTKVCTRCGKKKPLKEFATNRSKPDGLNWQCRGCQAAYHKDHYEKHKARYIQQAKDHKDVIRAYVATIRLACTAKGCHEDHPATLDFHHKDPSTKEANVAHMITRGWSINRVKEELRKCRVLCSNCHRKLHWRMSKHH
jgi:hypothetical protein